MGLDPLDLRLPHQGRWQAMTESPLMEGIRRHAPRDTVLVVDDEPSVRASVRTILEGTCEVLEAEGGAEALDLLRTHDVDLVMLDQRMPGEAGLDLLPRLKAIDSSIVVVMVTAVHEVRTAVEALKGGAYDYLTKPFDVGDILLTVRRALEKRALERVVPDLRSDQAPAGDDRSGFRPMVGRHRSMVRIYQLIAQVAQTPTTSVGKITARVRRIRACPRRSTRRPAIGAPIAVATK